MNSHSTSTLETERLILRKFKAQDIDSFFSIFEDEEVNTFLPWFPLKSLAEAETFFQKHYAQTQPYQYAICLKTNNIPIGYIHIGIDDSHDLGYGLQKEFWHKGIATEAGHALLAQAKKDGLPYVTATHDVKNPKSGEVMKRLGMRYQYTYEEQWQPKNIPVLFRMYQCNLDGQTDRVYRTYWDSHPVHFVEKGIS